MHYCRFAQKAPEWQRASRRGTAATAWEGFQRRCVHNDREEGSACSTHSSGGRLPVIG